MNGDLAVATTDALQLFLNEAGRYPLLTAEEEVELAKRIERGDDDGQGADDQLEPAPRRLDREALPGPRAVAARPDPGGDHRADPRGREVRLAPRLQVLDVRDVVDPPGRPARRGEQVADDPDPRAHRSSASRRSRARSASSRRSSGGSRPTRRSPKRRSSRSSRCARCARPRVRSRASTGRSGAESDAAFGDLFAVRAGAAGGGAARSASTRRCCGAPSRSSPTASRKSLKRRYGLNGDQDPASLEEIGRELGTHARARATDRGQRARAARGQPRDRSAEGRVRPRSAARFSVHARPWVGGG